MSSLPYATNRSSYSEMLKVLAMCRVDVTSKGGNIRSLPQVQRHNLTYLTTLGTRRPTGVGHLRGECTVRQNHPMIKPHL